MRRLVMVASVALALCLPAGIAAADGGVIGGAASCSMTPVAHCQIVYADHTDYSFGWVPAHLGGGWRLRLR